MNLALARINITPVSELLSSFLRLEDELVVVYGALGRYSAIGTIVNGFTLWKSNTLY